MIKAVFIFYKNSSSISFIICDLDESWKEKTAATIWKHFLSIVQPSTEI